MKKLATGGHIELKAVVVYEDELRELSSLLRENCKALSIEAEDDLQFDNIEELITHYSPNITTQEPYMAINFWKVLTRVYAESSIPAVEGLRYQCIKILTRRGKARRFLCSSGVWWTTCAIVFVASHFPIKLEWNLILVVFWLPYAAWVCLTWLTRHSLVYARKADSFDSFFQRNKDKLILQGLTAFVSIIIGILVRPYLPILTGHNAPVPSVQETSPVSPQTLQSS
jgi:hypothetical protein